MNLRRKENNFIQEIFGIEKLKSVIYDFFKDNIINLNNIRIIKGLFDPIVENKKPEILPIYTIIKDNYFLHPYKTINDILCYTKGQKKSIIIKNAILACLSGMNPIPFVDIGTYYLIEKKLKRELSSLYHFDIKKNIFFNDSQKKNEENNKIKDEANKEKDEVGIKAQIGINCGRGISQGVKIGIEIADVVHDISYINNIKNILTAFINGCKSSIIFTGIGMVIGGGFNFGLILYVGNYFSNFFEEELKKDNGEKFLLNAIKDFNQAIKSFSENKISISSENKNRVRSSSS